MGGGQWAAGNGQWVKRPGAGAGVVVVAVVRPWRRV
jgi:hypothetical protein